MMRRADSVLRHHGPSVLVALLLVVLWVFFAFASRRTGLNLWPDLVSGMTQATVVTGPLASAACALDASRRAAPHRQRAASAARPSWYVHLREAVRVVSPVIVTFPIALVVLGIYTAVTGTYGAPQLAWLCALWACLILASCFGHVVGSVIGRTWYAAIVAGLGFFGGYVLSQVLPVGHGATSLFPAILHRDSEFVGYVTSTMWGQSLFFVSVAAVMIFGTFMVRRRDRAIGLVAIGAFSIVAVAGAVPVVTNNGQYTYGYNSRDFVCAGEAPRICLNRGYADALGPLTEKFDRFATRAAGTGIVPALLEQNVQGIGDEPSPGASSVYLEGIDDDGLDFAVYRYVSAVGATAACTSSGGESIVAVTIVESWLSGFDVYDMGELDQSVSGAVEYQRLMSMSDDEGNRWLLEHWSAYRDCRLSLADLP